MTKVTLGREIDGGVGAVVLTSRRSERKASSA
jgi:hypothetical protein